MSEKDSERLSKHRSNRLLPSTHSKLFPELTFHSVTLGLMFDDCVVTYASACIHDCLFLLLLRCAWI